MFWQTLSEDNEFLWQEASIEGTSLQLEKKYLRLTSVGFPHDFSWCDVCVCVLCMDDEQACPIGS